MNRSNIVLIGLVMLFIGLIYYATRNNSDERERTRWSFDYRYDVSKKAYDRDFFIDLLKKQNDVDFETLEERFSRQKELGTGEMYFYYNSGFDAYNTGFAADSTETDAILKFVAKGNSALIISGKYGSEFFRNLRGIHLENEGMVSTGTWDSAGFVTDSLWLKPSERPTPVEITYFGWANILGYSFDIDTVNLDQDAYNMNTMPQYNRQEDVDDDYADWEYEEETESYEGEEWVEETIPSSYELIGHTTEGKANLIKINYGDGVIYLHSSPVLFTNVQLDKPEVFRYVNSILSEIDYTKIYWDELKFQFLNKRNDGKKVNGLADKGYFQYIFKNKALKTAFYFVLIGLFVFVVIGIKRKYNTIEIMEPMTNSSIEFSKTIARLYWLNPDHKKIAEQKVKMFLSEVRNRYGLSTHELNASFREQFKAKSGLGDRHINRLFNAYVTVKKRRFIHEDLLKQISESIAYIRQSWK